MRNEALMRMKPLWESWCPYKEKPVSVPFPSQSPSSSLSPSLLCSITACHMSTQQESSFWQTRKRILTFWHLFFKNTIKKHSLMDIHRTLHTKKTRKYTFVLRIHRTFKKFIIPWATKQTSTNKKDQG